MYIKVHRKGNQWFRDDNGALLGEDCIGENFADYPYVKIKDVKVRLVKGYLDENGFFIPVCKINPNRCTYNCILGNTFKFKDIVCPYKNSKNPTFGYYANIPYYLTLT